MTLYDYFVNPVNYVAREKILHLKSVYAIKLYAAQHGETIQFTEPEIDNEGHDFTIFKGTSAIRIQNKATINIDDVKIWSIHPNLIQVVWHDRDIAPHVNGSPIIGRYNGNSGGIILNVIDKESAKNNELNVKYYYFDVWIAGAFWLE